MFRAALACFAVAGLTGALFRFELAYALGSGLRLDHIRHAHSHLMYFGWVTPALMALIGARLPAEIGRRMPRRTTAVLIGVLAAALASWPLFLLFGYEAQAIGGARLPPSVIVAGLNMLLWYAWGALYVKATRGASRTPAVRLWDLALVLLIVSTLGAWGISLVGPLGIDDPVIARGLTQLFLGLFSEGWLVVAVLGLAWSGRAAPPPWWRTSIALVALGLPFTFPLAMSPGEVPAALRALASVGTVAVGVGLLVQVRLLFSERRGWGWRLPLALLAAKSIAQLAVAAVPSIAWTELLGLRLFYLHVVLLGFVSIGILVAAERTFGARAAPGRVPITVAALVVLASLIPLTLLWPSALGRLWAFELTAWIALLPPAAAIAALAGSTRGSTTSRARAPRRAPTRRAASRARRVRSRARRRVCARGRRASR